MEGNRSVLVNNDVFFLSIPTAQSHGFRVYDFLICQNVLFLWEASFTGQENWHISQSNLTPTGSGQITYKNLFQSLLILMEDVIGGSKGARTPGSKLFHFHAVFGKRFWLGHPIIELPPPSGKSCIRYWMFQRRKYVLMTSIATDMYEFFPSKVNNLVFSAAAVETQKQENH